MDIRMGASLRGVSFRTAARPVTAGAMSVVLIFGIPALGTADVTMQPGTFHGFGFDTCDAPGASVMRAWRRASPFRAVGVYIGGLNRSCDRQPNLTATWVARQVSAGWHIIPIYVGPQASCAVPAKYATINNSRAAAMGRAAADDAARRARALGFARDTVIVYDMEPYLRANKACRNGVLAFMSAWTSRLHDHSYASGFYGSLRSGVADQVANYNAVRYARPDYLSFARWDGKATTNDPAIPASYWYPHRRLKQYVGDRVELHGGVRINIDRDFVDFAPLPPARFADFDSNRWSDVLARDNRGNLYLYPGNGTYVEESSRKWLDGGWKGMGETVRIGDLNGDGREDVLAVQKSTGDLWFYPGTRTGFGTRKKIGHGWNGMRELTPIGDMTGDGVPDLLAIQNSTNRLMLYPGRKVGLRAYRVISGGWKGMSELTRAGDYNRDGRPDLIARRSDGRLYLYPGRGTGFGGRRLIGIGWNGNRDLLGVGDFDRDGYPDLVAIRSSDGALFRWRGTGGVLRAPIRIGNGWRSLHLL